MMDSMAKMMEKEPLLKKIHPAGSFEKMKGWPVQTVREVMGVTTTTTVRNVKKQSCAASLFKVPKGYKLEKSPSMEDMMKKQ
jgi:hypothetical protein